MSKIRVEELETLDGLNLAKVEDLAKVGDPETGLDRRVIYVDTVADLQALDTSGLVEGQGVIFRGTADPDDGGQSLVFWGPGEDKEHHNGITIIDPTHSAAPGSKEWYRPENTGDGCFVGHDKDKILNYVSKMVFQGGGDIGGIQQSGLTHPVVLAWNNGKNIFLALNITDRHTGGEPRTVWKKTSNDYGLSWSDLEEFVGTPSSGAAVSITSGGVDKNGTGYLFIRYRDPTSATQFIKTDDKGNTWSDPKDLDAGSFGQTNMRTVGQMEDQDGRLFVPIYGGNRIGNAVSYDGGDSFITELVKEAPEEELLSESDVVAIGDGKLLMLARTGIMSPFRHLYSTDNGDTWEDAGLIPWFKPGGTLPQLWAPKEGDYIYTVFANRRRERDAGFFKTSFTPSIRGNEVPGTFEPTAAEATIFVQGTIAIAHYRITIPSSGYDVNDDAEGFFRIGGITSSLRSTLRLSHGVVSQSFINKQSPEGTDPSSSITIRLTEESSGPAIFLNDPAEGAERLRVEDITSLNLEFQVIYLVERHRGDMSIPNGWVMSKLHKDYFDNPDAWRGPVPIYIPHTNVFENPQGDWGYGKFADILGDTHMFWYNGNYGLGGSDVIATNLSKLGVLADSRR